MEKILYMAVMCTILNTFKKEWFSDDVSKQI